MALLGRSGAAEPASSRPNQLNHKYPAASRRLPGVGVGDRPASKRSLAWSAQVASCRGPRQRRAERVSESANLRRRICVGQPARLWACECALGRTWVVVVLPSKPIRMNVTL